MSEQGLDVGAAAGADRVKLGDDPPAADDREVLAVMLDGIKDVGEVPGGIGGANLGHQIRLSDIYVPEQRRIRIRSAHLGDRIGDRRL